MRAGLIEPGIDLGFVRAGQGDREAGGRGDLHIGKRSAQCVGAALSGDAQPTDIDVVGRASQAHKVRAGDKQLARHAVVRGAGDGRNRHIANGHSVRRVARVSGGGVGAPIVTRRQIEGGAAGGGLSVLVQDRTDRRPVRRGQGQGELGCGSTFHVRRVRQRIRCPSLAGDGEFPGVNVGAASIGLDVGAGDGQHARGRVVGGGSNGRRFIYVGHADGHGPGSRQGTVVRDHNVEAVRTLRFEVGRGLQRDGARAPIDVEQRRIGAGQAVGKGRAGIGVHGRGGVDRRVDRRILGHRARSAGRDGRRVVRVGHADGHGLGVRQGTVVCDHDGEVVNVVAPVVGGRLVIGRCVEAHGAGAAVDGEESSVGAGEAPSERRSTVRIGGGSRVDCASAILRHAGRATRGDDGRLVGIGDGDRHGLGRGVVRHGGRRHNRSVVGGRDGDVVDVVTVLVARRFVVGRRLEADFTGAGIDIEKPRIVASDTVGQRLAAVAVAGGDRVDSAGAVLSHRGRGAGGDLRRVVLTGEVDRHRVFGSLACAVRGRDGERVDFRDAIRESADFLGRERLDRCAIGHVDVGACAAVEVQRAVGADLGDVVV